MSVYEQRLPRMRVAVERWDDDVIGRRLDVRVPPDESIPSVTPAVCKCGRQAEQRSGLCFRCASALPPVAPGRLEEAKDPANAIKGITTGLILALCFWGLIAIAIVAWRSSK